MLHKLEKKLLSRIIILAVCIAENIASKNIPDKKNIKKAGTIILFNGTSSAGKTTLIKALHQMYDNFDIASLDEYTKTHQFNGFADLRYHHFYEMINSKAAAGKNILVDTVLYHKNYKKYDGMLKKHGVRFIKILVYCPIDCLLAHIQQRNQSGNPMEHRTINQAFRAFLALYTMQTHKNKNCIDTMHSQDVCNALQQSMHVIARWSEKQKKRQKKINKKMARHYHLDTPHTIFLTPAHPWHLVVNTSLQSVETIAQQLAQWIQK
jgi:chloramphenicol 3-O-phosphotransferase